MSYVHGIPKKPFLGTPIIPTHPLAKGLAGCWLMNEGAGYPRNLVSGKFCTGDIPAWGVSYFGPCLALSGATTVITDIPSNIIDASGSRQFTIVSRWLCNDVSAGNQAVVGIRRGTYLICGYTGAGSGKVRFGENDSGQSITSGLFYSTAFTSVSRNHYVNAVVDPSVIGACNASVSSDPIVIGAYYRGSGRWNGLIDFVTIYTRVLSPDEIRSLYLDPYQMFRRSLIELWTAGMGGIVAGDVTVSPSVLAASLSAKSPAFAYDCALTTASLALQATIQAPSEAFDIGMTVGAALGLAAALNPADVNYDFQQMVNSLPMGASVQVPGTNYDYQWAAGLALGLQTVLQNPTTTFDLSVAISAALGLSAGLQISTVSTELVLTVEPSTLQLSVAIQTPTLTFDYLMALASSLGMSISVMSPTIPIDSGRTYIVCSSTDPAQLDFYVGGVLVARMTNG